jgi:hypothetical protein
MFSPFGDQWWKQTGGRPSGFVNCTIRIGLSTLCWEFITGKTKEHAVANKIRKIRDLGALHDLLLEACPPNPKGIKSTKILADHLNMSAWGVHLWIKRNRIPPKRAKQIVDLAHNPKITLERFSPFIYG